MKNEKQTPRRLSLPLLAGLFMIALLLGIGSWYSLAPGSRATPPAAADPPPEIPEEAADPESPRTPTPGFFDDFENGLDPVWAVHYGDVRITAGQLTSHVGAGIAAGDKTWKNYQIEFDVDTAGAGCTFTDSTNSLGVRVDTFDYAYYFIFSDCEAAWSFYPGGIYRGQENLIPQTRVPLSTDPLKHIRIQIQGSTMSAYEGEVLLSAFEDSSFTAGGIFLQLEAQTFYDNFRVTLLP